MQVNGVVAKFSFRSYVNFTGARAVNLKYADDLTDDSNNDNKKQLHDVLKFRRRLLCQIA